eukprot:m.91361 g.91361  ORF g.91361 m.91361 type:complete len:121 (-) comp12944_c0_seq4:122-484(-)
MGLCKCRVVTSLFCVQHTKNVCEKCMVSDHPTCVVRSYKEWLNDSDYATECTLCGDERNDGRPCIRLGCYDVFHWACLEKYINTQPPTTTPAGFICPCCRVSIDVCRYHCLFGWGTVWRQ